MLEIVLTSSESDQYSSAPNKISKFPLMYMTGYFCRSVFISEYVRIVFLYVLSTVVLVTCKNEEDPIKNEGARVLTSL